MAVECSIVVPLYNEEPNLPALNSRLTAAVRGLSISFEIIYVDDGSTDGTAEGIRRLHEQNSAAKGVFLSRNFGHQAALCAGLEAATGRAVITIDGDLQDPPELIPALLDRWKAGFQVVYAKRRSRREGVLKRGACFVFYRALRRLAEVPIPLDTGDYALMDRTAVEHLNSMPERARFIRGLRSWIGFNQTNVLYDRDKRQQGDSKYSLGKLARLALDGIFSFSAAPLKAISLTGGILLAAAVAAIVLRLAAILTADWTAIAIVGLAAVQLLGMGILGEYVSRIHHEVRERPLYVPSERLGFGTLARPAGKLPEPPPCQASHRGRQPTAACLSAPPRVALERPA